MLTIDDFDSMDLNEVSDNLKRQLAFMLYDKIHEHLSVNELTKVSDRIVKLIPYLEDKSPAERDLDRWTYGIQH